MVGQPDAPFFAVGTLENPVASGASFQGAPITVTCVVRPSGGSYTVDLSLTDGEQYSINISGTLTDSPGTTQTGIDGELASNVSQYASTAGAPCTIQLTTQAPGNTPITAGRVWGTLNCPAVSDPETNSVCAATATFLFENCQH
jgi:hypothetical protein